MKLKVLLSVILILSFESCQKEDDKNDSNETLTLSDGTYNAPCEDDGQGSSDLYQIVIAGDTYTTIYTYYDGTTCASGSETNAEKYVYDYVISGKKLTITLTDYLQAGYNSMVTTWNSSSECGKNNWADGVFQSTVGIDCDGFGDQPQVGDTDSTDKLKSDGDTITVPSGKVYTKQQ